jgi:subtilisin family serine protease
MLRAALSVIALFVLLGCTVTPTSNRSLMELEQDLREQRFNRLIVTVRDPRFNRHTDRLRTDRPVTFLVTANDLRQQFFGDEKNPGEKLGLKLIDSYYVKQLDTYTLVYESDDVDVLARAAMELRKDRQIDSVIPVNTYQTRTSDPLGNLLPGIRPSTLDAMHRQATGVDVDIAIIDTGVDILHEDIAHEQFTLFDMVGADHPPESHGTAIAGIIAAVPDNGIGIRGIAPDASILMLRACWQGDEQQSAVCTTDTIAKALALALKAGVDIVNLSLTGPMDPLLEQLVRALIDEGTIVVAAHADTPDHGPFPGAIPGVLAASARTDQQDNVQTVFIPGSNVMTLLPGNRYGPRNGTSISAAQLSGLAALFLQRHPGMTAQVLREKLRAVYLEDGNDTLLVRALASALEDTHAFAGEPLRQ